VELSLLSGARPTSGKPAVVRIRITSGRSLRRPGSMPPPANRLRPGARFAAG